jgi:hypothetical protein
MPCPPNGLSRAAWFRWLAAELEDSQPQRAAYCRDIAGQIERGVFGALPLIARMTDGADGRA